MRESHYFNFSWIAGSISPGRIWKPLRVRPLLSRMSLMVPGGMGSWILVGIATGWWWWWGSNSLIQTVTQLGRSNPALPLVETERLEMGWKVCWRSSQCMPHRLWGLGLVLMAVSWLQRGTILMEFWPALISPMIASLVPRTLSWCFISFFKI